MAGDGSQTPPPLDGEEANAFLSETARRLLQAGPGPDPRSLAAPGVVLLCDLSGFSRMGAETVAKSERGAEVLQGVINAVFARIGDVIARHGGSVLYYAGDAVAVYWPTGEDRAAMVRAAVACGRAVQEEVGADPVGDRSIEMRAGVGVGDMWLVDAGASGGRQAVFCGPVLDEMAALDLVAGGVRLTEAALALVAEDARVETDPGASIARAVNAEAWPAPPPPPAFDVGPWLRAHQRAGLSLGRDWVAEFRQVHVLFVRAPSFAYAGPQDTGAAADVLRAIAAAVEAEGGTLGHTCFDDKGLVGIAAWGLATSVWEDGADRAVRAAQALAQDPAGPLLAAVTAGKVFAGLIGAPGYVQHVAIGDALNRAAAMCMAGRAPVTLDADTRAAVARRFDTQEVARLPLKGQAGEAAVYAVTDERLRQLAHEGDLIGRGQEKRKLEAIAGRLARGEGAGEGVDLCLTADAGMGKSRLAAWFETLLEDVGVAHLQVQGDAIRRAISYAPLGPLVTGLLGLDPRADAAACRVALMRHLDPGSEPLLSLLSPLLPTVLPETDASRALAGAGRAAETRDLAVELLARLLGEARTMLVVEDAHWLDSASWQLLDVLTRRAPVSVCLVTRPLGPDDVPTEARRFLDRTLVETLDLGMLDEADSGALAAQTLGATAAAPRLADLLHDKAAGHPLFTMALAQALDARGLVEIEKGYAHLRLGEAGLAHLDIPADAAGAIKERISRLTPSQQLTIRAAAVLGRRFSADALAELHPSAGLGEVEADLTRIGETGLIEPEPEGGWAFHHAIVADAAYHSLVTEQARRLHAAAAARIAAQAGDTPKQGDLALLAHHAERAGDRDAALRHLAAAGENAKAAYANLETVDFLTRALTLGEGGDGGDAGVPDLTRAQWRYDIAYALRALGQYQRSEDFLKACIGDLDRSPPETGWQAARGLFGGYANFRMRPHRPRQPDAVRAPVILAADATMMLSELHYELNKIPQALAEILRGANLARAAGGDSATLAKLYIGMALISTALPWALDGDDLQQKALAITDRLDDPATEGWVYMVSGNYESGKGGWDDGEGYFRHAMKVSEACGERKTWETSCSTLANLKRLEGRFEEAIGWSDITLAASRDRGVVHGIIWSHNGRSRDLLSLSRWDEMREDVAAMERLLDDPANALDANDNNRLVFYYARAALALEDGRDPAAIADLEAALEIVGRTKRPQVYMTQNAPIYCDLIWALRDRGLPADQARGYLDVVTKSAARIGKQYRAGVPMAALAQGDGHWARGRGDKAAKSWRISAAAADERGMSYAAAEAWDRLTRTGLADETAARDAHLARARIELPRLWRLSG